MAARSFTDRDCSPGDEPVSKRKPPKPGGHWSQGLLNSMTDPEKTVKEDDKCVVIKDAYPKARHHYLVLPKENISSLRILNRSHVSLLKHMLMVGRAYVQELKEESPKAKFQLGYHAIPSMTRLHMHIVSQDFDSPCLKNKKHWNSFTTEFFLDAEEIIEGLETNGKVVIDKGECEDMLKRPLKCHVCDYTPSNMPKLKSHITSHQRN